MRSFARGCEKKWPRYCGHRKLMRWQSTTLRTVRCVRFWMRRIVPPRRNTAQMSSHSPAPFRSLRLTMLTHPSRGSTRTHAFPCRLGPFLTSVIFYPILAHTVWPEKASPSGNNPRFSPRQCFCAQPLPQRPSGELRAFSKPVPMAVRSSG